MKTGINESFGKLSQTFESKLSVAPPQDPAQFAQVWQSTFKDIIQSLTEFRSELLEAVSASVQTVVPESKAAEAKVQEDTIKKDEKNSGPFEDIHSSTAAASGTSSGGSATMMLADNAAGEVGLEVTAMDEDDEEKAGLGKKRLRKNTDPSDAAQVIQSAAVMKQKVQGLISQYESTSSKAQPSTAQNMKSAD